MKSEAIFPNIGKTKLPFVTPAIGLNKEQCPIVRESGYCLPQLIFGVEGEGVLETEGKIFSVHTGDIFFLPAKREHRYYGKGKWVTSWIHLAGEGMQQALESLELKDAVVVSGTDTTHCERLLRQILTELKVDRLQGMERSSIHLYELLLEFYMLQHEQPQNKGMQRLLPLLDYIDDHIAEQMTLAELAGVLGVTPQHLCRAFKEALSMRPFEYITKRRIQISKRYLADRSMKIATIGKMVGIRDVSYYCYNFKRLEGITPNEFRAQNF
ncbi:MAG: helix-turn-helix transcriptional regulator [Lachnospiraceae bacterium]|nr:helix-turn-helix transcriptional regulator [Lachnospiraceae bacterium]